MLRKKLKFMNVKEEEILTREEMKHIMAGCGGCGGCCYWRCNQSIPCYLSDNKCVYESTCDLSPGCVCPGYNTNEVVCSGPASCF